MFVFREHVQTERNVLYISCCHIIFFFLKMIHFIEELKLLEEMFRNNLAPHLYKQIFFTNSLYFSNGRFFFNFSILSILQPLSNNNFVVDWKLTSVRWYYLTANVFFGEIHLKKSRHHQIGLMLFWVMFKHCCILIFMTEHFFRRLISSRITNVPFPHFSLHWLSIWMFQRLLHFIRCFVQKQFY